MRLCSPTLTELLKRETRCHRAIGALQYCFTDIVLRHMASSTFNEQGPILTRAQ
jgi:hypothetical protein